jgi:hypothetical protein
MYKILSVQCWDAGLPDNISFTFSQLFFETILKKLKKQKS